jgi:hypothetical protein
MSRFGITVAVLITLLAVAAAAVYFAGYADDVGKMLAKRYYGAQARAEATMLGKVGAGKAEEFLKGEYLFWLREFRMGELAFSINCVKVALLYFSC